MFFNFFFGLFFTFFTFCYFFFLRYARSKYNVFIYAYNIEARFYDIFFFEFKFYLIFTLDDAGVNVFFNNDNTYAINNFNSFLVVVKTIKNNNLNVVFINNYDLRK